MDWNSRYLTGDTPWDHGTASPPLEDYLRAFPLNGKILVPGCGRGHEVRLLARSGCEPLGLDCAEAAIAAARQFPPAGREIYQVGDFLKLTPDFREYFDALVEHTCFCAIPPEVRAAYVESSAYVLKPGGCFVGVFFTHIPDADFQSPPYPCAPNELQMLFAPLFSIERIWEPARCLPGREDCTEKVYCFKKNEPRRLSVCNFCP